jgi:hypothetical protein
VNIEADNAIDRGSIAQTTRLIRPHVRRTPVIEVDAADFGLAAARLSFKLELLQHAGSFKTRSAFANQRPHGLEALEDGRYIVVYFEPFAARLPSEIAAMDIEPPVSGTVPLPLVPSKPHRPEIAV